MTKEPKLTRAPVSRRCPINLKTPVAGLMPSIVRNGPSFKGVKNLGWLIRNWRIVEAFDVYPHPPLSDKSLQPDAYLVARLRDGRTFETGYSSIAVMRYWLKRSRTLRDVPVTYLGATLEAGGSSLNEITKELKR